MSRFVVSFLAFQAFARSTLFSAAAVEEQESKKHHGSLIVDAFNMVDSNVEEFKRIWDSEGYYKVCFAGATGCMEGNYDQVFQPFIDALKTYRLTGTPTAGNDETGSGFLDFSAFLETKLGCKAMYRGTAYNEIDTETGQVTKHISYSNDSEELMNCVGEYFSSLEDQKDL